MFVCQFLLIAFLKGEVPTNRPELESNDEAIVSRRVLDLLIANPEITFEEIRRAFPPSVDATWITSSIGGGPALASSWTTIDIPFCSHCHSECGRACSSLSVHSLRCKIYAIDLSALVSGCGVPGG